MITHAYIGINKDRPGNISLGNRMFFMASTIGIAIKNNFEYGFEPFYPDIFPNQPPVCDGVKPLYRVPWGFHDITPPDNVALSGYMQSEKYFTYRTNAIRHHFEMSKQTDYVIDGICVHYRRGDYITLSDYHYDLSMDYYERALSNLSGQIYVFSDEPQEARKVFGSNVEYIEGNDVFTDLYLMRQCKHFVIANSSLSWWAAWLSGEVVYAPKNWFGEKNKHLDTKDIYCKDWIVI